MLDGTLQNGCGRKTQSEDNSLYLIALELDLSVLGQNPKTQNSPTQNSFGQNFWTQNPKTEFHI